MSDLTLFNLDTYDNNNILYLYSLSRLLIAQNIDHKIRILAAHAWNNHRG